MKNRANLLAGVVLLFGVLVFFWTPTKTPAPPPVAWPPPPAPEDVLPEVATISRSFGDDPALPAALSDDDFREMTSKFSEPDGSFMYENFLSNEQSYQDPIPNLTSVVTPGRVYLGVGPEQNFTYIAAIRPQMAFIIDIRRQNMLELLLYKALFAMAANRREFVSLLFSRRQPQGLSDASTVDDIFRGYRNSPGDRQLFESNLGRINEGLSWLSDSDKGTVAYVYNVFFSLGPELKYSSLTSGPNGPTYEQLMTLSDQSGRQWSFLASEERFRFIKEMQARNMVVPIVGDFSGPKAIRAVARYLKDRKAVVGAFYLSNVEMYIVPAQKWKAFCRNVSELPMDTPSTFIRYVVGGYARYMRREKGLYTSTSLISPMIDVLTAMTTGYPPSYYDLIRASR
jgi:hypothetical protein